MEESTLYNARKPHANVSYYNAYKWSYNSTHSLHKMGRIHGAKRVFAFFLLTTILPASLIIVPLYLRHSVFADVIYPVAESDILAIVDGISPFFCESHTLQMNSSFHAFQLSGKPKISHKRKHIRLKKSMRLPDDTLEYWGFYLLEGAFVKLKACSRYDGSRILVVRGEKNLKTCGLLEHNLMKSGAKLDQEHNQVKVTFENDAEVIGVVDNQQVPQPDGREELDNAPLYLGNSTKNHKKRHINHRRRIEELKKLLSEDQREKRDVAKLDGPIAHGGNAFNNISDVKSSENSVSSFETDLLNCYDGQILLAQGFPPSHLCTDVHYLQKSNHIVTVHEVATSGYYYYIFYSDNDLVHNDIHAVFDIYKPTYRFANQSKGNDCINQTECNFPIHFWSDDTVIVEVPTIDGIEHNEDHITLLTSTCHPRMAVYVVFPISALFLILGCAFL